ncbi:hypothetical protein C9374_003424 [Naegleria lovaniensis]|uniref:Uncharacterized protein n=1 Tax=Naegleria lovaniensis TaxID=51637 RepID=A0AA88GTP2_NAELO|nr:uncharacterized protein C9374_003424 [Naegleria lovaniensis]KAG2385609.1 hypothetical protein C9374_003424 [Naegleria lovaniensis]
MNCQLYNQFLDYYIPVLHQLQQEMNTHQVPRINYKLITKVTERNFYQITAYLQIADNESKEKIDKFCQLGKQYLGDVFVYSEPHMSMGYRIAKNESKETKKAIVDVLNKHLNGTVLSFGHPQVCKFDDMCEFKPIFSNL